MTLINEIVSLQPPLDVERSMKKLAHTNNKPCPSARLRVDGDFAANPVRASSNDGAMTVQQLQRMPWLASDFEQKFFEAFGREMRLAEREFFGMGTAQPPRVLVPDCANEVSRPDPLTAPDSGIDRVVNKREED